jgi:hypothetical protein
MTQVILSAATQDQLGKAILADATAKNRWVKAVDLLVSDGVKAAMLKATKTGENDKLRAQVKAIIVSTFTKAEQALLAKETKTLKDDDKKEKRRLIQETGRYLSLIEGKLASREAQESGDEGEKESPKTELQKIQAKLDEVISKLTKLEDARFDVVQTIKNVKALKGSMPAA